MELLHALICFFTFSQVFTKECKDNLGRTCISFAKSGHCSSQQPTLKKYMEKECALTCGYCQASCGKRYVQNTRIISGHDSLPGSWPWQVSITLNGRHLCGGSLIDPTTVITAAHCFKRAKDVVRYLVRSGYHKFLSKDGSEQLSSVSRFTVHEKYSNVTLDNDIAIVKLKTPVKLNTRVNTVCLPTKGVPVGTKCYVSGWGKTAHPGKSHHTLQQSDMIIQSSQDCSDVAKAFKHTPTMKITPNMLCAGHGSHDPRTTCHGDSGGPLVCESNGVWSLQGVVSWGAPTCQSHVMWPVFARVTRYNKWIESNRV